MPVHNMHFETTIIIRRQYVFREIMKTHLDCIPCFLKQSLEAARMATDDEQLQQDVLQKVMSYLTTISLTDSPPEISREIHNIIRSETNTKDPYKKVKTHSNFTAQKQYAALHTMIEDADDPLLMAVKLAIVGNVIDFGSSSRFDVTEMLDKLSHIDFDATAYPQFQKALQNAQSIVYLADNTGEIFYDKLLLSELSKQGKTITYVVRAHPIINDATIEDAYHAEIDKIATIIAGDEGQEYSAPGMVCSFASPQFLESIESADMVISKGQGNYEGLSSYHRDIFFLFVVKCPLVAREVDAAVGTLILKVNK